VSLHLAGALPAPAQDSLTLDPIVSSVITGGAWAAAGEHGTYRLVVLSGGFEHITSVLYVQWLREDPERREVRVRATRLVAEIPQGIYSLGTPTFEGRGREFRVEVTGTDSHTMATARWALLLGAPGRYTLAARP